MIGARWNEAQRSMWPPSVVVGAVTSEDGQQVSLAEDEDAVGEFGSGGQDEAFGEAVGPGTWRWDLHGVDAGAGQDCVERGGEFGRPRVFRIAVMGVDYAAICRLRYSS